VTRDECLANIIFTTPPHAVKLNHLFILLVCLALASIRATSGFTADFAIRTGQNGFFRTTQTSDEFSAANGSFTIEFWFKASGPGVLVNEVDAYDIQFWDYSILELDANGKLLIGLPGIVGVTEIGSVALNTWNHVAIRYDGATERYEGVVNGQKSPNVLQGVRRMPSPRLAYFAFGRNAQNVLASGGPLPGDFDEVRVWNSVRSDAQIQDNQNLRDIPIVSSLMSVWHLDDGSGENLSDSSGHNHPGLIVGAAWTPSTRSLTGAPLIISVSSTITDRGEDISALVNPAGAESSAYVESGLTPSYDLATAPTLIPAGNADVSLSFALTNLTVATYHYRLVTTNGSGGTLGPDLTFSVTNLSGYAAVATGANYVRSEKITRPFFTNAALTIEFWFYPTGPGVLLNEVDAFTIENWDYSLMEILADGTLVAALPNVPSISLGKIEYGRWHNGVLRYDPATSALDLFVDGAKLGTSNGTRSLPWDYGRSVYFCLGRGGPDNLGGGSFFKGKFDEVRIWRIAVSDAELALTRGKIISGAQPNLFAYWSFESIVNDLSPDNSSNQNRALFVNGAVLEASGIDLAFDPRPTAVTGGVSDSIGTIATLSGAAYSQDTNTVAYFIWGVGQVTNQTAQVSITGKTNTTVQATLNGLEGGINYWYSLIVSNAAGVAQGAQNTFLKLGWGGYALSTATNSYIRTFADQRPFFPDESMTVEIWLKPKRHGVVMSETDRINSAAWDVSLIEILADGSVVAGFPGVPSATLGTVVWEEWNSIVLRYSKAALKMDGFVNGVSAGTSSTGDRMTGWEGGRSINFTFGKSTLTKLGSGQSLPGEWDEIRIWNTARTDQEITTTYNRKLAAGGTNLVAYWRFDDRLNSVTDSSGRSNRAVIVGPSQLVISGVPISLTLTPISFAADGTVTIQYIGTAGNSIRVEATSDFKTWTVGPTSTADSLGVVTFNVGRISDFPARYFRFRQL
jgi:hypothetical protein